MIMQLLEQLDFETGKVIVFAALFILIVVYGISCATSKMPDNNKE